MNFETTWLPVILAVIAALSPLMAFFNERRKHAADASDRLIDQLQEELQALRTQQDADRERYVSEIGRLRQEIDVERQARIAAETEAAELRARYERQVGDLRAQLEQATVARNDRLARIKELETELETLRRKVDKLDTGELKA